VSASARSVIEVNCAIPLSDRSEPVGHNRGSFYAAAPTKSKIGKFQKRTEGTVLVHMSL